MTRAASCPGEAPQWSQPPERSHDSQVQAGTIINLFIWPGGPGNRPHPTSRPHPTLLRVVRQDVWPVATPLTIKLHGCRQELEKTTPFIARTGMCSRRECQQEQVKHAARKQETFSTIKERERERERE